MGVSCLCGSFVKKKKNCIGDKGDNGTYPRYVIHLFIFLCHPLVIQMIDKCEKTSYIIGSVQSNRFIANQLNKLFIHSAHLESICFRCTSCFNIDNHGWTTIWSSDKQTLILPHLIFKTKLFISQQPLCFSSQHFFFIFFFFFSSYKKICVISTNHRCLICKAKHTYHLLSIWHIDCPSAKKKKKLDYKYKHIKESLMCHSLELKWKKKNKIIICVQEEC